MTESFLNIETKKQIVEEVLQSDDFAKSQKYQKLLKYLAEASIKGENIKSSTLAFDFFGKEATYDPSIDSTVRSYISNLRKKLEHYYLTEGESSKYKILIPKGNYHLEFEINNPHASRKSKTNYLKILYPLVIATLSVIVLFLLFQKSTDNNQKMSAFNVPLWNSFIKSKKKTLFVIGDYYVYKMNFIKGRKIYVRDIQINSSDELKEFMKKNPNYKKIVEETSNSYLDESTPFCLASILPAFILNNVNYDIKLSSDLQLKDLQNNNIIYIGSHKSLNLLSLFTRNLNFEYNILPGGIKFYDEKNDTLFKYSIEDKFDSLARRDFPVVIKETGPNNNSFLLFLSIFDLGNISTVKYFTHPDKIKKFIKQVNSKNFIALFESRGYRREDFSIKLLHVNKLPSNLELPVKQ